MPDFMLNLKCHTRTLFAHVENTLGGCCIDLQYARLGDKTDTIRREFALQRHHKMSAIVMGWVAALVVLLVSYEFSKAWWNAVIALAVWGAVAAIGYYLVIPYLLTR